MLNFFAVGGCDDPLDREKNRQSYKAADNWYKGPRCTHARFFK